VVKGTSSIQSSCIRRRQCEIYGKEGREEEYVSVIHSTVANLPNL
jgi:hypothetical protein